MVPSDSTSSEDSTGSSEPASPKPDRVRLLGTSYKALFESNPLPMWVYDVRSLRFLAVNDAAVDRYGYRPEEWLRMTIKDLRPPEEIPRLLTAVARLDSGTATFDVWKHRTKDGRLVDVEVLTHEIDFNDHRARLVLAHDITQRLRTERQLRTAYAVTRELMEATSVREAMPRILRAACEAEGWEAGEMWSADASREVLRLRTSWSTPGADLRSLEREGQEAAYPRSAGTLGRAWATGRARWITDLAEDPDFRRGPTALAAGLRQAIVIPLMSRAAINGVLVFFGRGMREPEEDLMDLLADLGTRIGQAIEAEAAEASHRGMEERFAKAFYDSPVASAISDLATGRILDANDAFLRLVGYLRGEVLGRTSTELGLWSLTERADFRERLLGDGAVRGLEVEGRRKDGGIRRVTLDAGLLARTDPPTVLTILVDVTGPRMAAERASFLASIVENSDDAIVGKTLDGVVTSWNGAAERLYGWRAEEILHRSIDVILPEDRKTELAEILARVRNGETIPRYETKRLHKDGRVLDVAVTISPIRHDGRIIGASAITRGVPGRQEDPRDRPGPAE